MFLTVDFEFYQHL